MRLARYLFYHQSNIFTIKSVMILVMHYKKS